jgi:hypothetical protein
MRDVTLDGRHEPPPFAVCNRAWSHLFGFQWDQHCFDYGWAPMTTYTGRDVVFPSYSGIQCLMMPYIQGDPNSVPDEYAAYRNMIASVFVRRGDVGYLTIDESEVCAGKAQRGYRAKSGRALHTEAGMVSPTLYGWGLPSPGWGTPSPRPDGGRAHRVLLDRDVTVLLANSLGNTCAIWQADHEDTSEDGDIGHLSTLYPYEDAIMMRAGEVHQIGILTPHESLPVPEAAVRQFIRIVSSGVHGREPYFTANTLVPM